MHVLRDAWETEKAHIYRKHAFKPQNIHIFKGAALHNGIKQKERKLSTLF